MTTFNSISEIVNTVANFHKEPFTHMKELFTIITGPYLQASSRDKRLTIVYLLILFTFLTLVSLI